MNFNKIASFGMEDTVKELTQDIFVALEDDLAQEMIHDLAMSFNKIASFGIEDTAKELTQLISRGHQGTAFR